MDENGSRKERIPVSTYRLQLHRGFGFRNAQDLLPYLNQLGVTDCYTSPILKARPGSTHGYDIINHNVLNPELGTDTEYDDLSRSLKELKMGHLLDFVPNHMGNDSDNNPWWRDVLENGPSSPFAGFFDIDWRPLKPELKNKVLLPILGDQYGAVLERGELRLSFDDGAIVLLYGQQNLPLNPRQTPELLKSNLDDLQHRMNGDPDLREFLSIMTELSNLPTIMERDPSRIEERQREKEVARERLARLFNASAAIQQHIQECLKTINGQVGNPASFDALHRLLEAQAYRLAYWKTASHEINYRRFFDINQLAGLRMERPEVFEATHRRLIELIHSGNVTGLRLDHPDGLYDPATYFESLRTHAGPIYVVVEKILSAGESLRKAWPVAGTSGYDFLNLVSHLFLEPRNGPKMKAIYERFIGRAVDSQDEIYRSKKLIMSTSMASELNVLAYQLNQISETNRHWRDFTLDSLRDALREVVACFPVYRTYIRDAATSPTDELTVTKAIAYAKSMNPAMESSIFDFIRAMLVPKQAPDVTADDFQRHLEFAMKFQQYTAPVQAKGVEDTAFYRYNTLISVNEVGGDLSRFGISVSDFHQANLERQRDWPHALLATATHDTKHGEDSRMRLNVLSELPEEWDQAVFQWSEINHPRKTLVDGRAYPDPNDEYFLYQALLSIWPADAGSLEIEPLRSRLRDYYLKALREAKRFTSWIRPNEDYEKAAMDFLDKLLSSKETGGFLSLFEPFVRRIAADGMTNSLAQLVLKMASPGVPDFYQGTDLWDWSLVDPDNRRPVNFETRKHLLQEIEPLINPAKESDLPARRATLRQLLLQWEDGRIKLFLTMACLRYRRLHPDLFLNGAYTPLKITGELADHAIAFAREEGQEKLVVVVPRLIARFKLKTRLWESTRLQFPESWGTFAGQNLFTGEMVKASGSASDLSLSEILSTLPVAWIKGHE